MYTPSYFAEHDRAVLTAFMREHSFAVLTTADENGPTATHLPLLVDDQDGKLVLRGHVARANPQWRSAGGKALAVFSGPHAFISSGWYDADDVVPTWNYQTVHARGTLELIEDDGAVQAFFADLARAYEGERARLWQERLSEASYALNRRLIVAFRIEVETLAGTWKLSQHHPAQRRQKVVAALRALGGEDNLAIAAAMEATLRNGPPAPPA